MWRMTIFPSRATGISAMRQTARMAASGGLMIGVEKTVPKRPGLVMVKVPPRTSSAASLPARACSATSREPLGQLAHAQVVRVSDDRHDEAAFD